MRPQAARGVIPEPEDDTPSAIDANSAPVPASSSADEPAPTDVSLEASRQRAAALPSYEERRHKEGNSTEPYKLVVLQQNGMPAIELTLRPVVARVLALFTMMLALGSGAALGFQARPMLARGHLSPIAAGMLGVVLPIDEAQAELEAGEDDDTIDGGEPTALARKLGLGTRKAASLLLGGRPRQEWVEAANEVASMPNSLAWPVKHGGYVRGYGSGMDGYHLAVDVSGKLGTDVLASAGGIVGYSGDGIRGYGHTVILIHPGGWITMYAHNEANLVVAGEQVKAKQTIARLGNSGISRGPHVHYEFMFAGNNCDPAPLFRPGVMHLNGKVWDDRQVDWKPTDKRPRDVRCSHRRRHPLSRWVHHEADADLARPARGRIERGQATGALLGDVAERPEAVAKKSPATPAATRQGAIKREPEGAQGDAAQPNRSQRSLEASETAAVGGGPSATTVSRGPRSRAPQKDAAQPNNRPPVLHGGENSQAAALGAAGVSATEVEASDADKAEVETAANDDAAGDVQTAREGSADEEADEAPTQPAAREPQAPAQVTESAPKRAQEPETPREEPEPSPPANASESEQSPEPV